VNSETYTLTTDSGVSVCVTRSNFGVELQLIPENYTLLSAVDIRWLSAVFELVAIQENEEELAMAARTEMFRNGKAR
jgi:hypothetical protein